MAKIAYCHNFELWQKKVIYGLKKNLWVGVQFFSPITQKKALPNNGTHKVSSKELSFGE